MDQVYQATEPCKKRMAFGLVPPYHWPVPMITERGGSCLSRPHRLVVPLRRPVFDCAGHRCRPCEEAAFAARSRGGLGADMTRRISLAAVASLAFMWGSGCGETVSERSDGQRRGDALLLAVSVFGTNQDGSPKPLPARLTALIPDGDEWRRLFIDDPDSNVFHKALVYRSDSTEGLLTLGGTQAIVKLWSPDGHSTRLWERDFGGDFSRMRDAEVGDLYGDGSAAIAIATHDQGVVAVLRPDPAGGFSLDELDAAADTVVHEIELGDLDGDGVLEVYATPTPPNRVDGTPQPGTVARYVPAVGEGRVSVADLGSRHAKEILVQDVDGDGRDELYVSVEAVSGGQVEIRRYEADTDPADGQLVATLNDRLCRFLTAGDVDGDGGLELVAATHRGGIWLLQPDGDAWSKHLIASDSSSFEHAAILLDLDDDGRDELYVASDDQGQVRRYSWDEGAWTREIIWEHTDGLPRFTWNIMPMSRALWPDGS